MEAKISSGKVAFKWGVIYFFTAIVLTYVFQLLNIDQNSPVKYISLLFFVVYLILAQKEYKDRLNGYLTYNQGFVSGLLYSVYASLLSAVFIYVYLKFLSPQIFEQSVATSQEKLESAGTLSSEQIETAMAFTRNYGVIIATVASVLIGTIFGIVVALISAAVLKNEAPMFVPDENDEPPL